MVTYTYLSIASFVIRVVFEETEHILAHEKMQKDIEIFFSGFIAQKIPTNVDYEIIFRDQVLIEVIKNAKNGKTFVQLYQKERLKITTFYHISIIQLQSILREVLLELLTQRSGFMLHCSASVIHNEAHIFLGHNGSGKSTLVQLIKNRFLPLADDLGIIRKVGLTYYFFQTPLSEKNSIKKTLHGYHVGGVHIIHKSLQVKSERINISTALLESLFEQLVTEKQFASKQLHYMMKFLTGKTKYYHLFFPKKSSHVVSFFQKFA